MPTPPAHQPVADPKPPEPDMTSTDQPYSTSEITPQTDAEVIANAPWAARHFGRSWSEHPLEDACPCPKAPCGLVVWGAWADDCDQHNPMVYPRTIRQSHPADQCPDSPRRNPTMTTADLLDAADTIAPVPASRDQATREAWIRHYAAQAVAAYAAFRAAIRTLPRDPELDYLIGLAVTSTAAAAALADPADAPGLIYDLTPEAGALNGEWEEWLDDTLADHGINPADLDPDLNPADFADTVAATQNA